MSLKYRTSAGTSASNFTDVVVKVGDTLPIGTEVDYDGQTAPAGWQEIDDPNVYSTTEKRIGTWIDGKPLYRKVVQGSLTLSPQTWVDTDIVDSTIDLLINAKSFYAGSNTAVLEINANRTSDGKIQVLSTLSTTTYPTAILLEYTKTTD